MFDRSNRPLRRLKNTFVVAAIFALALGTGCGGCKKSDSATMPTSADARVEHLTGQLPTNTEIAIVAGDIKAMQSSLNQAKDRMENVMPMVSLMQQQIQSEFGINILSDQSWQQAGINTGGGFVLATIQQRPVMLTYVEDRQAFESTFIDRLKRTFQIEAPNRVEDEEGRQFKVTGTVPSNDIAWFYDGKLAVVAMPAIDANGGIAGGSALNVANIVAGTKKSESLNKSADFQRFYKVIGKNDPISAFLNAGSYLNSDAFAQNQDKLRAPFALFGEWGKENAQALGLGLKSEGDQVRLQVLAITNDEVRGQAKKAFEGAAKMNWEHLATSNTFAGLRISTDFETAYNLYLESLPQEQRQMFRRELKQLGESFDIDLEEDLLAALSGNGSIFFYGAHMPTLMRAMQGDIFDVLNGLGLIVSMQFKDTAKLDALVEKISNAGGGVIGVRPLVGADKKAVESIRVVELKNLQSTPGALYIKGDTLTFASSALAETSVHEYLTGTRKEPSLKDSDTLALGKRFATEEGLTGLYVNFVRARDNIGMAVPLPSVQMVLAQLHELLIEGRVTDDGMLATITLEMTPQKKAAE